MAEIFRKAALERLSSPEQLDKQIKTTTPMAWLAVTGVVVAVAAVSAWGFLGSLPEKKDINGVMLTDGYFHGIYTESSGVLELYAEVGDKVQKGDVIAVMNNEEISRQMEEVEYILSCIDQITLSSKNDPSISQVSQLLELKLGYQNNTQAEQYSKQLEELEAQLKEKKAKTEKLYKEYKDAESAYLKSLSDDDYNVISYDYQNASAATETAGNKYASAVSTYNQAASQYSSIAQSYGQAAESLASAKANYDAAVSALENAKMEYETARMQGTEALANMESQITQAAGEVSGLEAQYSEIAAAYGETSAEAISAKASYDVAMANLQRLSSEYDSAKQQGTTALAQMETQITQYTNAVSQYEAQYTSLQHSYEQAEAMEATAKEAYEKASNDMNTAKKEYDDAQAKADKIKKEYESAYKKQNSSSADVQALSQALNEKSTLYSNAYSEQMSIENSISNLQIQMSVQKIADTSSADSVLEKFSATKAALKNQYQSELDRLQNSMETLEIRSDIDGTVTMIGAENAQIVSAGSCIARIKNSDETDESHIVCFVPLSSAKQLKVGMDVTMTPAGVNEQEYGHMLGYVESISENNASVFEMTRTLGDDLLVNQYQQQGASVKIILTPEKDSSSENGYAWTNKKGKTLSISENTIMMANVITDRYAPITKLIPFLKDKLYSAGEGEAKS